MNNIVDLSINEFSVNFLGHSELLMSNIYNEFIN